MGTQAEFETKSQLIKQILEICEACDMPEQMKLLVKRKCWKLTRPDPMEQSGVVDVSELEL